MVSVVDMPGPEGSIDALLQVEPGDLPDAALACAVVEMHRASARLDAARVAALAVFDTRGVWSADAARNGPGWVAARTGVAYAAARADQSLGRDLRSMPVAAAAFARGTLSRDQARLLARARRPELAEAFAACEEILVEQVAELTLAAGARFLRRWEAEVRQRFGIGEPDGSEPAGGHEASRVHLSGALHGRWRLDGDLSAEDGEIVRNVVDAQVDQMWRDGRFTTDDGLTASERFASALVEVLVRGSAGGDDDGTARPLLVGLVHIDADACPCGCPHGGPSGPPADGEAEAPPEGTTRAEPSAGGERRRAHRGRRSSGARCGGHGHPGWDLADGLRLGGDGPDDREVPDAFGSRPTPQVPGDLFGVAELEHAGLVHPSDVGRWLCEGTLQVLVHHEDHDDLRLGRKVRIATRAQRRALRARDGGCVFPGCSVSPRDCVAHHVVWWEWGGRSDLDNLVSLCRHHHRAIHARGFNLTRDPCSGVVTVTRPDGTSLTPVLRPRPDPGLRPIVPRPRVQVDPDEAALAEMARLRSQRSSPTGHIPLDHRRPGDRADRMAPGRGTAAGCRRAVVRGLRPSLQPQHPPARRDLPPVRPVHRQRGR